MARDSTRSTSGRAPCLPRDDLDDDVPKTKELDGLALYILIAQSGSATAPRVYIGEADGLRNRIKSHLASKDSWSVLVVFYGTDGLQPAWFLPSSSVPVRMA